MVGYEGNDGATGAGDIPALKSNKRPYPYSSRSYMVRYGYIDIDTAIQPGYIPKIYACQGGAQVTGNKP